MLTDLLDIAFVGLLIYSAIAWLRSVHAHLALVGLGILGCVYLVAQQLGMGLTAWVFRSFLAAFLILVVILFHAELRQALERIALFGMGKARRQDAPGTVEKLVHVADKLSTQHRGALIVIPGRDPLARHLSGSIRLDGELSEPLLLSLFDPHSPGHDGAVILERDRVTRFAAHLPLATDWKQPAQRGTRHAAALGLSQETDALCIVVSEETGQISAARDGELRPIDGASALAGVIRTFLQDRFGPADSEASSWQRLRLDWQAVTAAFVASVTLWLVVVPGSEVSERTLEIPVIVTNLPPGYALERVEPPTVEAVVAGSRRDLFWVAANGVHVELNDPPYVKEGRRSFDISVESVAHPPGITVRSVAPRQVILHLRVEGS